MYWTIIVASDLHFGKQSIRETKQDQITDILFYKNMLNIEMVITAGDLTDDGTDGIGFCGLRKKTTDQLSPLIKQWVEPLEKAGIINLLTLGNHDTYTGHPYIYKPVFRYIQKRHDATYYPLVSMYKSGYYKYEKHGIVFLSLGIYPKYISWIKENLVTDKPMILFYHYNTITSEQYSDWWSLKEKDEFYELIKEYTNILCIINGHIHSSSYDKIWNGFKMINGGGNKMIRLNMKDDSLEYASFFSSKFLKNVTEYEYPSE
jgi:3',5'-cyclic AMP phosphodiesterase CpdA